jgi:hypothetical protein
LGQSQGEDYELVQYNVLVTSRKPFLWSLRCIYRSYKSAYSSLRAENALTRINSGLGRCGGRW